MATKISERLCRPWNQRRRHPPGLRDSLIGTRDPMFKKTCHLSALTATGKHDSKLRKRSQAMTRRVLLLQASGWPLAVRLCDSCQRANGPFTEAEAISLW